MNRSTDAYQNEGTGTRALEMLEGAERYNRWLFSWIAPFLGELNCELGAGHGTLTRFALEGHRVIATEPSDVGRGEIERRFRDHPRLAGVRSDFFQVTDAGSFDCIYSANVLEHVADDVAVLEHAAHLLKPGGRFIAVVPAGSWLYSEFDGLVGHYRRYDRADRKRLRMMLAERRIPLTLSTFDHKNPIGALGWLVSMRLTSRRAISSSQIDAAERLVPWLRRLDPLPMPFGQSLLLGLTRT